jgi:hypothetical protein
METGVLHIAHPSPFYFTWLALKVISQAGARFLVLSLGRVDEHYLGKHHRNIFRDGTAKTSSTK